MLIGIPRESLPGETRVAATPQTVGQIIKLGYAVVVESGAGAASSFSDAAYVDAGAEIGFAALAGLYAALVLVCTVSLSGELTLGRQPLTNLARTLQDFAHPSFLDVWLGPERLEYRSDDGTLLRVENRRKAEADFLHAVARATWDTFQIATLGSLLAALMALPSIFKSMGTATSSSASGRISSPSPDARKRSSSTSCPSGLPGESSFALS